MNKEEVTWKTLSLSTREQVRIVAVINRYQPLSTPLRPLVHLNVLMLQASLFDSGVHSVLATNAYRILQTTVGFFWVAIMGTGGFDEFSHENWKCLLVCLLYILNILSFDNAENVENQKPFGHVCELIGNCSRGPYCFPEDIFSVIQRNSLYPDHGAMFLVSFSPFHRRLYCEPEYFLTLSTNCSFLHPVFCIYSLAIDPFKTKPLAEPGETGLGASA